MIRSNSSKSLSKFRSGSSSRLGRSSSSSRLVGRSSSSSRLTRSSSSTETLGSSGGSQQQQQQQRASRRRKSKAHLRTLTSKTIQCGENNNNNNNKVAALPKEVILAHIAATSEDISVSNLIVQDLVSNTKYHEELLASLDGLIFANQEDREWQKIRFRDTLALSGDKYRIWRQQKGRMIMSYEKKGVHDPARNNLDQVIVWNANITIPEGTDVEDLMELLRDIKEDPSVMDMRLNGALPAPSSLVKKIDWQQPQPQQPQQQPQDPDTPEEGKKQQAPPPKNTLMQPICIDVECGWINTEEQERTRATYKKYINVCLCRFKEAQRENRKRCKKRRNTSPHQELQRGEIDSSMSSPPQQQSSSRSKSPIRSKSLGSLLTEGADVEESKSASPVTTRRSTIANNKKPTRVISLRSLSPKKGGGEKRTTSTTQEEESERSSNNSVSSSEPREMEPQNDDGRYWRSAVDPSTGDTYYYHKHTKETVWDKPAEMVEYEQRRQ